MWLAIFVKKACARGEGVTKCLDVVRFVGLREKDGDEMFGLLGAAEGDENGRGHVEAIRESAIGYYSPREDDSHP